jgi:hypothetical protein
VAEATDELKAEAAAGLFPEDSETRFEQNQEIN